MASAVQETCSSELLRGPGADFLRGVAFWSIRSSGLLRWFCATGAALRMTWRHFFYFRQMEWKNRKTHWYEAVSSAFNFPFFKEVSQNCFVFNVVNFEKLRMSPRIASFWMMSSSKLEEVSQNSFVFDVVNFGKLRKSRRIASFLMLSSLKNWGSLPELLCFGWCQVQNWGSLAE